MEVLHGLARVDGWWDHVAIVLLHNMSHPCPGNEILLALFQVSAPFSQKIQPYTPLLTVPPSIPCAARVDPFPHF